MSEKTLGTQLDELGLDLELPQGDRVLEATVTLITGGEDGAGEHHRPITLPRTVPGAVPVPHPVERRIVTVIAAEQQISDEQRQRVAAWLTENGIEPRRVVASAPITIESSMRGAQQGPQIIGFSEYYETPGGQRVINEKTLTDALTFPRWVRQQVPLEPDPNWKGWANYRAAASEGAQA